MTPSDRSDTIVVRRPDLTLEPEIPRYWKGGDPFATHFLNALSSVFPDGEAFFVLSVLHYRDQIDDPELLRSIQAFAAQEGQHSHQHDRHVRMLLDQGYSAIAWRNRMVRRMTRWSVDHSPRLALAGTAALEHLTALLARKLMTAPERWTGDMDPRMAPLWQWHALEEAEHKAVAFDVLAKVAPSHGLRVFAQVINTAGLFVEILDRTAYMLWKDGLLFRRRVWSDGLRFLFGREGLLRGLGRDYRAWYRRDFHPNDADDSALIAAWRPRVAPRAA
jgi:predicted metal-dependent hydrolase